MYLLTEREICPLFNPRIIKKYNSVLSKSTHKDFYDYIKIVDWPASINTDWFIIF